MEDDLQEWEMLLNPETDLVDSSLPGIQGDASKSLIRSDYFAFNTRCDDEGEPQDVMLVEKDANTSNDCHLPLLEEEIKDFEENPNIRDLALGEIDVRETPVSVENLLEASNDVVSEMVVDAEEDHFEHTSQTSDEIQINRDDDDKKMVWWKHPFQLLKFCVFRVSPVWTFSIAAAVVGILILKKRLSRIKQKSRTIPIKLTVEDKKVSQFMVRAARLNEAFSVVRRVPIIRPISPSGGVTPWPALNLR